MTTNLLALRKNSALLCALHKRFGNGCNDSGEQAKIAASQSLCNMEARVAHDARAAEERDAAFALAAGVPVIWAVRNLRGW